MSYPAPGSAGRASSSPAGVGVITADPAQRVGPNAPVRHGPTAKGFIDRPTIPLDIYNRIKKGNGAETQGAGASAPSPQGAAASAPSPLAVTNPGGFNGTSQGSPTAVPPDINGAVSSTQIASVVNKRLQVWTKSTSPTLISDRSFATVTGHTSNFFGPRILFDRQWKRWVISIDSQPESSTLQHQYLLISTTSDAAGGYIVYDYNAASKICGTSRFWDYPQIGMTQDAVILTGNCFNGNTFEGAKTFAVAKAVVYNAGGFSVPTFSLPAADGVTTPPVVKDQNPRAHLLTQSVHNVTFANPQAGFYGSISGNVAIGGFFTRSVPRNAGQAGCSATSCQLDTGDGRFVAPSTQYGDHLWNVATYGRTGNGTRATPSWGDFDTEGGGANTTKQKGLVSFGSCSDDFNASLAAGIDGRVWLNWSSTDPQGSPCGQSHARLMLAGRLASTPVNTMSNQLLAFTSCCTLTGNYSPAVGSQQWGGTSSVSVDPVTSAFDVAWAWNETVASSSLWGTRAQKVNND